MKRRRSISRSQTRRTFGRTADRTHKFNVRARPMRGGIRL